MSASKITEGVWLVANETENGDLECVKVVPRVEIDLAVRELVQAGKRNILSFKLSLLTRYAVTHYAVAE